MVCNTPVFDVNVIARAKDKDRADRKFGGFVSDDIREIDEEQQKNKQDNPK